MAANFDLSAMALQAVAPNNEVLYDDLGMPSIMVKIPKLTYAQLGMGESTAVHPAFIVNGSEVDAIWISKYQNIVQNSRAYSLPGCDPKVSVNFDAARTYCENKGDGWHLMTRMEWGLIVRWCQNNGVLPLGNNYYGRHSTETSYKAIPSASRDTDGNITRTATGTGPLTWYHDQAATGIADLCGNVWEWTGGVRSVYGELQVLANNNAADSAKSQTATSTAWMAIRASDGALIEPDGTGTTSGSVKMDYVSSGLQYTTSLTNQADASVNSYFSAITCTSSIGDEAKLLLQNLGMLMYGSTNELFSGQRGYWNNGQAERLFSSGGHWSYSASGLASFNGSAARSSSNTIIGFRSAFVNLPTA